MRKTGTIRIISICIIFICITRLNLFAQPQCDAGPNDTICLGESSLLVATGGGDYEWSTGATTDSIIVSPTKTTTYYVTVSGRTGNLICNGDFDKGDTCFTSAYSIPTYPWAPYGHPIPKEGEYGVTPNSGAGFHPNFDNCFDHTNPPTGQMMCVNGAGVPNVYVWRQIINVVPNTTYDFSAWVQSVCNHDPAELQFRINGTLIGPIFTASTPQTCVWQNFFVTWNSGANTSADIRIDNQQTAYSGNDFALDDITFSALINCKDSVTVVVNPLPTANAGTDVSICDGSSTTLTASGGVKYNWSTGDSINPLVVTPTITTTYTLLVTDINGCTDTDDVVVTVNLNPTADAGPDTEICIGETTQLTASGGNTYEWSTTESSSYIIVGPKTTTTYTVTVTNSFGCTDTDEVIVTVNPLPTASFSPIPDIATLGNPTISFMDNSVGATKWNWNFGDYGSPNNTSTVQFPTHKYSSVGTFTICLRVESSAGCKDSTCREITIEHEFSFYAPNAFSPNGDGNNDGFKTEGIGIDSTHFTLYIYDRWGEELFNTTDKYTEWNGTVQNSGREVQEGVYVWMVFFNDNSGFFHKYYGHVTLVR